MIESLIDVAAVVASMAAIGVGLWWIEPAYSLIGVGGIVLLVTITTRLRRPGK